MSDQNDVVTSGGATFRVAIIGTGRPRGADGNTGYGMAGEHAAGYSALPNCKIVALCDLVAERAEMFNQEKANGEAEIYTDYPKMLAEIKPDIVSICTWPAQHAPMVLACAEAGIRAIHCEKPISGTWGESRTMVEACREKGLQLTFNHQRRFLDVFQRARKLVLDGEIGELKRMEGSCGDMIDWGTHWLDMFGFYNSESAPRWVMGQIDGRSSRLVFGLAVESQAISTFEYENGVFGTLYTGYQSSAHVGCANRLIGSEGVIEVHGEKPWLRLRRNGDSAWRAIDDEENLEGGIHGGYANMRAIADVVAALAEGRKPLLDSSNAIKSTEIIFATYESARRRGRIDCPLTYEGNALLDMLTEGVFPTV